MNIRKGIFIILYFISAVLTYYLYEGSITIAGFGFMYSYLAPLPFVALAFACFLVTPNIDRMINVGRLMGIFAVPLILTVIYSLVLWIVNFAEFRTMTRGLFFVVYQMIAIVMAGAAVYSFGRRAVYFQFVALIIAFLMVIVPLIQQGGITEFFNQYIQLIVTGSKETGYMMQTVERAGFAHGIGIYLFYFILTWKENKVNIFLLPVAVFLFLMGFKRSALVGISVGFVAYVVALIVPKTLKKTVLLVETTCMIFLGLLYVGAISNGVIEKFAEASGIDTMGRVEIYNSMRPYYDFDITYMGRGLGFVSYMIGNGFIDVGVPNAGDIHSDFLRQFIELGMLGFIGWMIAFFYWRFKKLIEVVDIKFGVFLISIFAYCFGCYFTENMYYNYRVNLAIAVVIFSYALQRTEERPQGLDIKKSLIERL